MTNILTEESNKVRREGNALVKDYRSLKIVTHKNIRVSAVLYDYLQAKAKDNSTSLGKFIQLLAQLDMSKKDKELFSKLQEEFARERDNFDKGLVEY